MSWQKAGGPEIPRVKEAAYCPLLPANPCCVRPERGLATKMASYPTLPRNLLPEEVLDSPSVPSLSVYPTAQPHA